MRHLLAVGLLLAAGLCQTGAALAAPPNVVLVITDDQGYGDISAHGNTVLRTPHLDRLHGESVRLTDFHVDPTCAPTRSALLTGRYSTRTGVWHTIMGRSMLSASEVTLADRLAASGYRTGQFGKWHLGDNAPLRAHERGFQESVAHGGGGITQVPDWFGNDYFDDVYFRNGVPEQFTGYCTDVFFDEALAFIERNQERPFFCYLATNAPHFPYTVADEWKQPYVDAGVPEPMATFYGMIANIDNNLGRLLDRIDSLGLSDNTIVIFMTDNGSAEGLARVRPGEPAPAWPGFNAGMRGLKGSEYDGGHRVPCFIRWPAGGIGGGRDVDALTAHIDILPTLVELCGLERTDGPPLDGMSLAAALRGDDAPIDERTLFVHSQRVEFPEKWRQSAVMTKRWRLINGRELFDMAADPGQAVDVAAEYPNVLATLRESYDAWWTSLEPVFSDHVPIAIGDPRENPARLTGHDWHAPPGQVMVMQDNVRNDPLANGTWWVEIARPGGYRFTLRSRPEHAAEALRATSARVKVGEQEATAAIDPDATSATLTLVLDADAAGGAFNRRTLDTWLTNANGDVRGAYFVDVHYVEE
ncbi:MAG: arylsulfatase [Planctomyces sp.]|nr:arylsulfatase [Planctomyces sp.]